MYCTILEWEMIFIIQEIWVYLTSIISWQFLLIYLSFELWMLER